MASGSSWTCLLLLLDVLSGPLISLVYPLFATVQAIENSSNGDLHPVLTYWVLHSLITLFELVFSSALEWIPIWGSVKTIINCVLVLPSFHGSAYVYEQFLKPFVSDPQLSVNVSNSPGLKDMFNELFRILTTGLNYINGIIGRPQLMGGGVPRQGTNNASSFVSNFEDGSTFNGFRGGNSTYNGYDNRSNSYNIYDDWRTSSSRRVRGYNHDD